MSMKLDRVVTVLLSIAVLGMATVVVRREFFAPTVRGVPPAPPTYEGDWRAIAAAAAVEGTLSAPAVIVEFADLQCPGCRAYQRVINAMKRKFGQRVAVVFVHVPITYHEHAIPAARGAECAGRAGRFHRFIDVVYAKQESLGVKSMWGFASDAGLRDSAAFATCLMDTASTDETIRSNLASATNIRVQMTPTIVVNGWRFKSPPSEYYLEQFIRDQLDGKGPVQP